MVPGRRRWRLVRQVSNGVAPLCVAAAVLVLCAAGYAGVPALGPRARSWPRRVGVGARRAAAEVRRFCRCPGWRARRGLVRRPWRRVRPGRRLADAMLALGYLHARFRLTQMDLQRRLAEGRLSQLVGARRVCLGRVRAAARPAADRQAGVGGHAEEPAWPPRCSSPTPAASTTTWPSCARAGSGPPLFSLAGVYPPAGPRSTASPSRA